jgi:hypothetical protein
MLRYLIGLVSLCSPVVSAQYSVEELVPRHVEEIECPTSVLNSQGDLLGHGFKDDHFFSFMVSDGEFEELERLIQAPGFSLDEAKQFNDRGLMIGTGDLNGNSVGFLYDPEATELQFLPQQPLKVNNRDQLLLLEGDSLSDLRISLRDTDGTLQAVASGSYLPVALNDEGQVLLLDLSKTMSEPAEFSFFIWQEGQVIRRVASPAGYITQAIAMNRQGDVAGMLIPIDEESGYLIPILWTADGKEIRLKGLGNSSFVAAINDQRQIVGSLFHEFKGPTAFLWTETEGVIDLNSQIDRRLGWTLDEAIAINNRGQILVEAHKGALSERLLLLTPKP